MSRIPFLLAAIFVTATAATIPARATLPTQAERPNILWIVVDDMSANFGCYGETAVETPNVDRLAAEGTRFSRAYVTAPVCSTCRSAMITGMYQTTIGAHHHRSGRGRIAIHLPDEVTPVPRLFQEAGYFTCIGSGLPGKDHRGVAIGPGNQRGRGAAGKRLGKTDYNFQWDLDMYDSNDWADRGEGQPFFMQVQLHGGKLRGDSAETNRQLATRAREELGSATDPSDVQLPPYYPRDPVLLEDWAAYLDSVRLTDHHVGQVLDRLRREQLLDNTLIIFMTDHGISHARGKQFLYNEGAEIPFVVRGPGVAAGSVRDDLIMHIDMAALSLAAAGIEIPSVMQGRDILAEDYRARIVVFAARDRCDETVERIRSVRTNAFLYIRNFYPNRPHLQPNAYKDKKAIVRKLRQLHDEKQLDEVSERVLFSETRAAEELYQYQEDSWQVVNLADDPKYQETLARHRELLDHWIERTGDPGAESEEMYDSDMEEYLKKANPDVARNIATMKRWAAEGK